MLRPSKHAHPDRTVVNVSLLLLMRLRARRLEEYESLKRFITRAAPRTEVLFVPALDLLYLLGLVEYRPKTDAFEYVGPNETF